MKETNGVIEITKKELEDMYKSMTNEEVCKKLKMSKPTLTKLLKQNNIGLKNSARTKVKVVG